MGGTSETVSERVIRSVAIRDDSDPLELPPLFNAIDPDVLEAGVKAISDGNIQFEFAGYAVTVYSDETVNVSEASAKTAAQAESASDD